MADAPIQDQSKKARRPKGRSPSYPGIDLESALQRAEQLYDHERGNAAHLDTILKHWGYKATTGPGRVAFAALRKFGLLDTEGSGGTLKGRLSELALRILQDQRPDSFERLRAIQEAALTPSIHQELWEKYQGTLPSDDNLRFMLLRERSFTETGAAEFVPEFRATIAFAKLAQSRVMSSDILEDQQTNQGDEPDGSSGQVQPLSPLANSKMQNMTLPVAPGENAVLQAAFPLTEAKWNQLMGVLTAMKPALVAEPAPRSGGLSEA